jgi:5,5'-dehydrodivanillate O-demethylase
MLTEAQNKKLTQVGPGTPMGELLRRYWTPIAGLAEFDTISIKPVRLMGEDLVLYKDLEGNFGLIDRQCTHRRSDMAYGFVEQSGIRCSYHGWEFNAAGNCTSRPFEDTANPALSKKVSVKIKAYPVQVKANMIWAYLGPQPAPLLPDWEPFSWNNGFVQIVVSDIPCNWLQCQENSIDPVHFEWMHNNWSTRLKGELGPYAPEHKELGFDSFDYGLIYKRIRGEATKADKLWTIGRVCLWPNAFFLGDHFEWRVPVDDENSLSITWSYTRLPKESEPYVQAHVPAWKSPIVDEATGRWITSHVINQDIVAWVGQGKIADRTKETLGLSDQGIVMLRRRFFADLEAVAAGKDPSGLIRDPEKNVKVALPIAEREFLSEGMTREEMFTHPIWKQHIFDFRFAYGQPAEVRAAFNKAAGIE